MVRELDQVRQTLPEDPAGVNLRTVLPRSAQVHYMVALFRDHLQHMFQSNYSLNSVESEVCQHDDELRRKGR